MDFQQYQHNQQLPQKEGLKEYSDNFVLNKKLISSKYALGKGGWALFPDGSMEFTQYFIPEIIKTVPLGGDIQGAINLVNKYGGGEVRLAAGTYTLSTSLNLKSNVSLVGAGIGVTILDFNSTSGKIVAAGTNAYTTGTISVSGANVTGSGTSWLANITALSSQIFLNGEWHLIAAVTGDTSLILAEAYAGPTISGSSYRIVTPVQSVFLAGMTVKGSTGSGLDFDDVRTIIISGLLTQSCNIGMDFNYCSVVSVNETVATSHTSHGVTFTNCGILEISGMDSILNGGVGINFNNVILGSFRASAADGNTGDGLNITSSSDLVLEVEASDNGGQGYELVSGNENIVIKDSPIERNTSDGIKLTASSDYCRINNCYLKSNGAYGVNIAASTCDNNLLIGNNFNGNTTAAYTDSGTGTIARGNNGITDFG